MVGYFAGETEIKPRSNQRRGRDRERFSPVDPSSEEVYSRHSNDYEHQLPDRQPRRTRSADSRPQYHNNSNTGFLDSSSPYHTASYREDLGFSFSNPKSDSDRAHSDVGESTVYHLPRYEAVVHDDSMLYSNRERRRYGERGNVVLPPMTAGRSSYHKNDRAESIDRQHHGARENIMSNTTSANNHHYHHNNRKLMHEEERRYYNYAKENLITFGGFDAPTASTGLSQEELLQRKRREETREKRKEKRRNNKGNKNRIINFPSSLLRAGNSQQNHILPQPYQQQNQSLSTSYQKMPTFTAPEKYRPGNIVYDDNGNSSNHNGYRAQVPAEIKANGSKDNCMQNILYMSSSKNARIFETTARDARVIHDGEATKPDNNGLFSMSSEQKDKRNHIVDDTNIPNNTSYDSQRSHAHHDYLLLQRDWNSTTPLESTPKTKGSNRRPTYAEFTPKSDYFTRDLPFSTNQVFTKETSPTSVLDLQISNPERVRWKDNLTQQEFIVTPQSTKLRPDSDVVQLGSATGKPKSILRSRYSSSYVSKTQSENRVLNFSSECPSDEYPEQQAETPISPGKTKGFIDDRVIGNLHAAPFRSPTLTSMMDFVNESGRSVSPIRTDDLVDGSNKFPESYVQFIEAVAAVVIQTKMRQKLAKNRVREIRDELANNRNLYRYSDTKMTPMVRKSYALARKSRKNKEEKKSKDRKDVALDFYSLAAIQIQAAFRGWWVRDCIGVDNYCATMIQKTYRGMRCRNQFHVALNRIITLQSICRRWMAMDAAVTRMYCIVRIQAIMRGSLVRKRMKFDLLESSVYHAAAITIQTLWRSFWCEMVFLRAYEDVLVVQSIVRGWLARRRARSILKAKYNNFSKRSQSKSRNDSSRIYSNHIEYMRKALVPCRKQEISYSQPYAKIDTNKQIWALRDNRSKIQAWSEKSEGDKRFQFTTNVYTGLKCRKSVHGSVERNEMKTKTVSTFATSVQKDEECRLPEFQEAESAGLEVRRKAMATKTSTGKNNNMTIKQVNKLTKAISAVDRSGLHDEEEKTKNIGDASQHTFAEIRKMFSKSIPSISPGKEDLSLTNFSKSAKEDTKDCKTAITETQQHSISSGGQKSFVAKKIEKSMLSNRNAPSKAKANISTNKIPAVLDEDTQIVSSKKAYMRKQKMPTVTTYSTQNGTTDTLDFKITPKRDDSNANSSASPFGRANQIHARTSKTSTSTYQETMQKLRSDVEQRRIDDMHDIFQKAGLLSRVK